MIFFRIKPSRALLFIGFLFSVALQCQGEDILILKDESETSSPEQQKLSLSDEEPSQAAQSFLLAYDYWRNFEIAFADGNTPGKDKALTDIVGLRIRNEVPKITEMALSLIQYGNIELSRNKPDDALNLFQAASAIDPSLPYAFYSQARVHLSRGVRGLVPAFKAVGKGFVAPLYTLSGTFYFYSKNLLILIVTLTVAGFVFAAILLIKYNKLLRHSAVEKFAIGKSPQLVHFLVWILLFVPVLLFLGPLWLAPFWLMLLLGYARIGEKILALFVLAVFILVYPAFRYVTRLSAATTEKFVSTYMTVFSDGPSPKAIIDLEKYYSENPTDADASILLAYVYKMDGRFQPAIETLQKHILAHPRDSRAYNNLANIFFLQEETDSALTLCERASNLDPRNAAYRYNLSNLHRAKFEFSEAERLLQEAREMNPDLIRRIEARASPGLADEIPTNGIVWSHIQKENGKLLDMFFNPFSAVAAACLLLAFINIAPVRKKTHAQACTKCGKAFCKRCHPGPREYGLCTQCLHIFVKRDGVSPISRKEKLDEIEGYSRRQNILIRLFSLLLPGSSSFYHDRTLFGILILVPWVFLVVSLLFNLRFAHWSFSEPPEASAILTPLYIVLLVFLYLLANLHQVRRSNI